MRQKFLHIDLSEQEYLFGLTQKTCMMGLSAIMLPSPICSGGNQVDASDPFPSISSVVNKIELHRAGICSMRIISARKTLL